MTDAQLPAVAERPKVPVRAGATVAALVPQSLEEAYRLANAMAASGLTPNGMKTPEQVLVVIMGGSELGFAPFQSCQSLCNINGRVSLWGDAIPALLWSNGFKLKEWYENESPEYPDTMIAQCVVTRPDGTEVTGSFSVADAKEAGLWAKSGPWQTARKRMLKMRARAFAARDGAADLLRGMFVAEEAQDIPPAAADNGAGTGMVGRLQAREVNVDPDVLNVREIANAVDGQPRRRTRRTKAQIDMDAKVSEFLEQEAQDGGPVLLEQVVAFVDAAFPSEVAESLERLGVKDIITSADDPAADAGSHMENEVEAVFAEGGEADTGPDNSVHTTQPPEVTLGEPAPAAEPLGDPEAAAEPASPAGTAAEAGTDGTGEPTSEPDEHGLTEEQYRMRVDAPYETEEAEVDEGESQPTSAASLGPANLYRMALANAGDFPSVRSIVTEFRKTTAFGDMDASERIEVNRAAVERLNDPSVIGVPGVDQNVWLFSLWMATADNEQVAQQFEALKQSGDWQSIPPERQAIIASAVHERTGSML